MAVDLKDPKCYINRELSWLEFNQRVLEQGTAQDNPLFERMKFLSIVASNLDEFYMIRVGSLREQIRAGYTKPDPSGRTADQQLIAISERVRTMLHDLYAAYADLMGQLEPWGVRIFGSVSDLDAGQKEFCRQYFKEKIYPLLSPVMIARRHPFPFVPGKGLNLGVMLEGPDNGKYFATIPVPSALPRMVRLPGEGSLFIPIEEIIRARLGKIFPRYRIMASSAYRILRNGDLDVDTDEAGDLLSAVKKSLRNRRRGEVVRLEIQKAPHKRMLAMLQKKLKVSDSAVYQIPGPINLTFLMKEICSIEGFDGQKYTPFEPYTPFELRGNTSVFDIDRADIFECIRRGDILLYHPFDSFDPVVRLIGDAADDKDVLAIKMTLYRLSSHSPIVAGLARAAKSGKQVTAFIEARARFDEENNIEYGEELERAGVNVIYGLPHLKTHSKITLILRREEDAIRTYMQLGTGNYNDVTARQYTDYSLLTVNEKLGADGIKFFNALTGGMDEPELSELVMAPFQLRRRFTREIRRQRKKAKRGEPAAIFAKFNSLVDEKIIRELYAASAEGVRIRLMIRGICCLRPGIKGISQNIEVRSVVGRFLEHSRVYIFGEGDDRRVYMSSADWMTRNLDRRVELLFPLLDPAIAQAAVDDMELYWRDNVRARRMSSDGKYRFIESEGEPVDAQEALIRK